jgi:nucleotide sugar dehydrogenase
MVNDSQPSGKVAVIGLGKIGLPLAAVFATNRYRVYGADRNEEIVASINQGKSSIKNEPGLEELVAKAHQTKSLTATADTSLAVRHSTIIIVIVPVIINENNQIDYQMIDEAVLKLAKGLQKDSLVIFETTLPPGDTRNRFGPMIEKQSGLKMGEEFYLAYSPERVYSNRIIQDLKSYPKIIGALDEKSLQLAREFYKAALGCNIIEVSSLETAEFSKVAESVYRDVNIALANELARFADEKEVDITEVITASNSQPYSNIHHPGIGVGGHCIPIYPYFFINKGLTTGLTPLARKINDDMADYAIKRIEKEIGSLQDKKVLILGLSYRENVKESTKSTTLKLIDLLNERRASVLVNDPQFTANEIEAFDVKSLSLTDPEIASVDVIIHQAFHKEYENLDFSLFKACKLVFDGRNKLDKDEIIKQNKKYVGVGVRGKSNE